NHRRIASHHPRASTSRRTSHHLLHRHRQKPRPKSKLPVQSQMLHTRSKRIQPHMPRPPLLKTLHHPPQQQLRHPAIPMIRMDRQWPEKTHTPPIAHKYRPHDHTPRLRAKGRRRIGPPTRIHIIRIPHECQRIWQSQKGSKGQTHHAVRRLEIGLLQQPASYFHVKCGVIPPSSIRFDSYSSFQACFHLRWLHNHISGRLWITDSRYRTYIRVSSPSGSSAASIQASCTVPW